MLVLLLTFARFETEVGFLRCDLESVDSGVGLFGPEVGEEGWGGRHLLLVVNMIKGR